MHEKHEFALYYKDVSLVVTAPSTRIVLDDKDVVRRIISVLRLQPGDHVVLFDEQCAAYVVLEEIKAKKQITGLIHDIKKHVPLQPHIIMMLPLLKRESFERMLYACVELGAQEIQLIETSKTRRMQSFEKEYERMYAIMISAAEQSKQFMLPIIKAPVLLSDFVSRMAQKNTYAIVADPAGKPLYTTLSELHDIKPNQIVLSMGPEGGFTSDEIDLLISSHFNKTRLTPTILRAQQAGALLLGVIRSVT